MALQELVLNSSSTMLLSFSTLFILIAILTFHILIFCLVCWIDVFVQLFWLLIECIWVYQNAFHTSPSHTLCVFACIPALLHSFCWALHYPPIHPLTANLHWAHVNSPQFCWIADTGSEGASLLCATGVQITDPVLLISAGKAPLWSRKNPKSKFCQELQPPQASFKKSCSHMNTFLSLAINTTILWASSDLVL